MEQWWQPGTALWGHTWFWGPSHSSVPLSVEDFGSAPHRRHLVFFKMIWAALPGQQLVQKTQHLLQVLPSVPQGDSGDLLLIILEFHRVPTSEDVRKTLPEWAMLIHTLPTVILALLFSSSAGRRRSREGDSLKGCSCVYSTDGAVWSPLETPKHLHVHHNDWQGSPSNILGNSKPS